MPSLPTRLASLLNALTTEQIAMVSPSERQMLFDQCYRVMSICEIERMKTEARKSLPIQMPNLTKGERK